MDKFAIQCGKKFIKVESFLNIKVWKVVETSKPTYLLKSEQAAHEAVSNVCAHFASVLANTKQRLAKKSSLTARSNTNEAKLRAKLEKLVQRPYCEVFKEVPKIERQLSNCKYTETATAVEIQNMKKTIARCERFLNTDLRVVKIEQTVVAI